MTGIKALFQITIAHFKVSFTFAISINRSNDNIQLEEKPS
jgi:hypothetical protein